MKILFSFYSIRVIFKRKYKNKNKLAFFNGKIKEGRVINIKENMSLNGKK